MSERIVFTLTRDTDNLETAFTASISSHTPWPELLECVILPGFRALGYMVDKEDLE